MAVNYAPTAPTAGQSRATKEVSLWTDVADTLPDIDTRLDTIEGTDFATQAELDAVSATVATKANTLVTVEDVATTSYTVVAADAGKVKRFTAAGAVTVTLPSGLATGTLVELLFVGAAGGTVAAGAGATVNGISTGAVAQHKSASALVTTTSTWNCQGAA